MNHPIGTVYLIHFETAIGDVTNPKGQAQHYLGWSDSLEDRLQAHRDGNGSKIMAAVSLKGIDWLLVKTWADKPRAFERKLKNQHHAWMHCPICRRNRLKGKKLQ